jgi:hypothetical protein
MSVEEVKLPIGTLGVALEEIPVGKTGEAYFPERKLRTRIYAVEHIRRYRDIIIIGANNAAKEHSPVEISYETVEHTWQRVTQEYPLPVDGAYALPASVTAMAAGPTLVKAPSSGKKLRVKYIEVFNSYTASITVDLRFTITGTAHFKKCLAPQTGFNANLIGCNWVGGKDEGLYINLSADGYVECTIMYMEE